MLYRYFTEFEHPLRESPIILLFVLILYGEKCSIVKAIVFVQGILIMGIILSSIRDSENQNQDIIRDAISQIIFLFLPLLASYFSVYILRLNTFPYSVPFLLVYIPQLCTFLGCMPSVVYSQDPPQDSQRHEKTLSHECIFCLCIFLGWLYLLNIFCRKT